MKATIRYFNHDQFPQAWTMVSRRAARGETMKDSMYTTIWSGEVTVEEAGGDTPTWAMGFLFQEFNVGDFKGVRRIRSMSVGDRIEIDGVDYVCAPVGWKKVDNTERDELDALMKEG